MVRGWLKLEFLHWRAEGPNTERVILRLKFRRLVTHANPIGGFEQRAAVEHYAYAILRVLRGDRDLRDELTSQIELSQLYRARREEADGSEYARHLKAGGVAREVRSALLVSEWFDGSGPGGVRGEDIPIAARIVSLAEHWEALTAKDGLHLSQQEALCILDAFAGSRHDPRIVRAAHMAVSGRYVRS
jgi:hypothetical protein